jgi:hypothetical protein
LLNGLFTAFKKGESASRFEAWLPFDHLPIGVLWGIAPTIALRSSQLVQETVRENCVDVERIR